MVEESESVLCYTTVVVEHFIRYNHLAFVQLSLPVANVVSYYRCRSLGAVLSPNSLDEVTVRIYNHHKRQPIRQSSTIQDSTPIR